MDDSVERRIGLNEASFRRVNEAIVPGAPSDGTTRFICECGRLGCTRLIELTRAEYEAVRAHPDRFVIVPGHEIEEAEDVVESHERHSVVQKRGEASQVAADSAPRRSLDRPSG